MIGYIYKITNPNGKIYVGKTFRLKKRINNYKNLDCKSQKAIYNSLLKYGYDLHKIDILEKVECLEEELNNLEKYWINYYNSKNDGLNCTFGGEGMLGGKHSDETKRKISEAKIGKKLTEEHKNKISKSSKGKSKPLFTEEHKNNLSLVKLGKASNASIKVSVYKLTGEYVGTYESFSECQIKLGLRSRISDFIAGRIKHVNGYIFEINK